MRCFYSIFSILAPHEGERLLGLSQGAVSKWFSILAPHEGERRARTTQQRPHARFFNPRSPRGGATKSMYWLPEDLIFSILAPHEGERRGDWITLELPQGFSILAPHEGERHGIFIARKQRDVFSILAPHEGERRDYRKVVGNMPDFQSSLPTRGSDSLSVPPAP